MATAVRILQVSLGLASLAWAAFLLPRTGLAWWVAANTLYAVFAFASAGLNWRGFRPVGLALAIIGVVEFAMANGVVATMACRTGGACTAVVSVTVAIVVVQAAVIIGSFPRNSVEA